MSTYISLLRFTEKGAQSLAKSVDRAREFDKAAKKAGVKIVAQYWTMGSYDGVLIISAKKSEQALACLVGLTAAGNVSVETSRAFSESEFRKMVK